MRSRCDVDLDVVVPCYNEEESIVTTIERLDAVCSKLEVKSYRLIIVDDGSTDKTAEIVVRRSLDTVLMIRLSRNFGQQAALTAGLAESSGGIVVTIDADLQDPPELIDKLLSKWEEGWDIVYTQRLSRAGETLFKKLTAFVFYLIIEGLSDMRLPRNSGDFRLMDRCVVEAFKSLHERDRYVRGLVYWVGFKQVAVQYDRSSRRRGSSKYNIRRMGELATDALLSFSNKPLRLSLKIGGFSLALSLLGVLYVLFVRIATGAWVAGWATLMVAILLTSGIQVIILGIIGEYIGMIYNEAKGRPLYIISEVIKT